MSNAKSNLTTEQLEQLIPVAKDGDSGAHLEILKALENGQNSAALRDYWRSHYLRQLLSEDTRIDKLIRRAEYHNDIEAGRELRDAFIGDQHRDRTGKLQGSPPYIGVPLLQYLQRCMAEQRSGTPMEQAFHLEPIPEPKHAQPKSRAGRPAGGSEARIQKRLENRDILERYDDELAKRDGRRRKLEAREATISTLKIKPGRLTVALRDKAARRLLDMKHKRSPSS